MHLYLGFDPKIQEFEVSSERVNKELLNILGEIMSSPKASFHPPEHRVEVTFRLTNWRRLSHIFCETTHSI